MQRSVVLVALVVVLAVGAGLWLQDRLFSARPADVPAAAMPAPVPPNNVAAAPAADAGPPDGGDAPATGAQPGLTLLSARGAVEKQPRGQAWTRMEAGDLLQPLESVRTAADGAAVLGAGGATLQVDGRSTLEVGGTEKGTVRLKLVEGRVSADMPAGGQVKLDVSAPGTDARVTGGSGRFSVLADGLGMLAVANETGSVRLAAGGKDVDVATGQRATARGDAPPRVAPVPGSLLLKVAAPGRHTQRAATHEVTGTATPGSVVRVRGKAVATDAQGRFRVVVPLRDGPNAVDVLATDTAGRVREERVNITVDRAAPPIRGTMTWGEDPRP